MSVSSEVELRCDGGGVTRYDCQWRPVFARTGRRARTEARQDGWRVNLPGGRDLCPDHARAEGADHD